jgi:hypothetical protein
MTINSQTRKAGPYVGTGSTGPFAFTFKVFQASDILVVRVNTTTLVETTLTLTTDYTVSLNSDQNSNPGGSVTLVSALATGNNMIISSQIPLTQQTDLTNQGGFYPEVINDALDKATIQIQQLKENVDRAAKLPITSTSNVDQLNQDIARLASSADNIDTVADNLTPITTVATNIGNVNTTAGSINNVNTFALVYQGAFATNPTVRTAGGGALQAGDLYFNTTVNELRVWSGTVWQLVSTTSDTISSRSFLATAGQTVYTFAGGYKIGVVYVWVNGVLLYNTDFTATNGTTITFAPALSLNDEVVITTFKAIGSITASDIVGLQTAPDFLLMSQGVI